MMLCPACNRILVLATTHLHCHCGVPFTFTVPRTTLVCGPKVVLPPRRPERAVLRPAWSWTCPRCGEWCAQSAMPHDQPRAEVEAAYRQIFELQEWEEVPADASDRLCIKPDSVSCRRCRSQFDADVHTP